MPDEPATRGREEESPPPPRDRAMLWAVLGAMVVAAVVVPRVFII